MTITVKLFTQKATIVKISTENTVDCSKSGSHFLLSLKYFLQCCKFYLLDIPQYKPDRTTCKKILRAWSCIFDSPKIYHRRPQEFWMFSNCRTKPSEDCKTLLLFTTYYIEVFNWFSLAFKLLSLRIYNVKPNQTKPKPLTTPLSPQNGDKKLNETKNISRKCSCYFIIKLRCKNRGLYLYSNWKFTLKEWLQVLLLLNNRKIKTD